MLSLKTKVLTGMLVGLSTVLISGTALGQAVPSPTDEADAVAAYRKAEQARLDRLCAQARGTGVIPESVENSLKLWAKAPGATELQREQAQAALDEAEKRHGMILAEKATKEMNELNSLIQQINQAPTVAMMEPLLDKVRDFALAHKEDQKLLDQAVFTLTRIKARADAQAGDLQKGSNDNSIVRSKFLLLEKSLVVENEIKPSRKVSIQLRYAQLARFKFEAATDPDFESNGRSEAGRVYDDMMREACGNLDTESCHFAGRWQNGPYARVIQAYQSTGPQLTLLAQRAQLQRSRQEFEEARRQDAEAQRLMGMGVDRTPGTTGTGTAPANNGGPNSLIPRN